MPPIMTIDNADDPRLAPYRDVRDVDLRGGGGRARRGEHNSYCMVESPMVIARLLESDWSDRVESLFLSTQRAAELAAALDVLPDETAVMTADDAMLRDVSGYRHHAGALCLLRRPDARALSVDRVRDGLDRDLHNRARRPSILVLAEGVTNVDNIGTIFRNAAAFGVSGVILRDDCADPLFRKAIRVSMGHVFRVPWAISNHWGDDLTTLRDEWAVHLIGAETMAGATPLQQVCTVERVGIVFGGEGHGLSTESIERCDAIRMIPMAPGVPSINVGVASAVFLYELRRSAAGTITPSGSS